MCFVTCLVDVCGVFRKDFVESSRGLCSSMIFEILPGRCAGCSIVCFVICVSWGVPCGVLWCVL